MNWKSFGLGFVVGIALLSGISHYRGRTQNVIKTLPKDSQEVMKQFAPWLTDAKVGKLGPFVVMAPKSFDATPEAMIQPAKEKNPTLLLSGNTITINDSKRKAITIDYKPATGEFISYTYISDLVSGPSFIDKNLSGNLVRVEVPQPRK